MRKKMKIFRDGVYFAEGTDLQKIADIAGEDVSRYSFDPQEQAEIKAAEADNAVDITALKKLLRPQVEQLPDEEKEEYAFIFPAWRTGQAVAVDDIRQHDGNLYRCVQAHTTQIDWVPDVTPALWVRVYDPNVIPVWTQPDGAHDAYQTGDKVYWPEGGPIWESTLDDNVWEPGVYGWSQVEQ
jgi:hypothetical protein